MNRFRDGRETGDWGRDERGYQGQGRDDWRRRYEGNDEDRWSSRGDWRGDPYRMDRDGSRQDDEYSRYSGSEGRRGEGTRWDGMRNEERGGYGLDWRGGRDEGGGYRGGSSYENQGYGGDSGQGYGGYRGQGYGNEPSGYGNPSFRNQGYGNAVYRGQGMQDYRGYGDQGPGGHGYGSQGTNYRGEGRYGQWRGGNEGYSPFRGQDEGSLNTESSFGRGAYREEGGYGGMGGGSTTSQRRGRPPKGYTRSDERIREDVSDRLGERMDASDITVDVKSGEVTLSGTVRDRSMKHHFELIADSVGGVKEVNNQIRVQREGEAERSTSSSTTGSRSKSTNDTANQSSTYSQRT